MGPKCSLVGAKAGRAAKLNGQPLMRRTGGAHNNGQKLPWGLSSHPEGQWLGAPEEEAAYCDGVRVFPKRNERRGSTNFNGRFPA